LTALLWILGCSFASIVVVASIDSRNAADHSPRPAAMQAGSGGAQCPEDVENPLPLPTSMSPDAFHDKLLAFLQNAEYVKLHWCVDKGVRDTGPYVYEEYLGTHPAVRVYYSPAIMRWLVNGRIDDVPDGAMIVKEMYFPGPAARLEGKRDTRVLDRDDQGLRRARRTAGFGAGCLQIHRCPRPATVTSRRSPSAAKASASRASTATRHRRRSRRLLR
jgi:hypothetical protein